MEYFAYGHHGDVEINKKTSEEYEVDDVIWYTPRDAHTPIELKVSKVTVNCVYCDGVRFIKENYLLHKKKSDAIKAVNVRLENRIAELQDYIDENMKQLDCDS